MKRNGKRYLPSLSNENGYLSSPTGGDKTSPPPLRGRAGWGKKIWRIKILWKIDHESTP
jgi:hypothetical protein